MEPRIQEEDVLIAGGDTNERKRKEFGFIWLGEVDLGGRRGQGVVKEPGLFFKAVIHDIITLASYSQHLGL